MSCPDTFPMGLFVPLPGALVDSCCVPWSHRPGLDSLSSSSLSPSICSLRETPTHLLSVFWEEERYLRAGLNVPSLLEPRESRSTLLLAHLLGIHTEEGMEGKEGCCLTAALQDLELFLCLLLCELGKRVVQRLLGRVNRSIFPKGHCR